MDDLVARLSDALGDRYEVGRELGRGGMGVVYLANDRKHDRPVAVKVLLPDIAEGVSGERFTREIRIAAQLQHPNILPLLDSGDVGGLKYYVTPFVEGESLRDRLRRHAQLPVADALRLTRETAEALAYAHRAGFVHRDIKPENILLSDGRPLLADFGVANTVLSTSDRLTETGIAVGTPQYMSPEQAAGGRDVGPASDIYSLGCVLYEMLVGTPPFSGPAQAVMARKAAEAVPGIRVVRESVTEEVEQVVLTATARLAADRYPTAQHLAEAIARVEGAASVPERQSEARLSRRVWIGGALAIAGLATLATLISRQGRAGSAQGIGNRVLVAPFINRTSDPALRHLGELTADWVARRLEGTSYIEVIDPLSSLDAARRAGSSGAAADAAGVLATARMANAGFVVYGVIYGRGDSLVFETEIIDLAGPRRLAVLDPVRTLASDVTAGVERIGEATESALTATFDPRVASISVPGTRPPTLDAFREFRTGLEIFSTNEREALPHFEAASRLDPTYAAPLVWASFVHGNAGDQAAKDSVVKVLAGLRTRLSRLDLLALEFFEARQRGDRNAALKSALEAAALSPGSNWSHNASLNLMAGNDIREALRFSLQVDAENGWARTWSPYWNTLGRQFHLLAQYDRELEAYSRAERVGRNQVLTVYRLRALTGLGRIEDAERLMAAAIPVFRPSSTMQTIGLEYLAHGHLAQGQRLLQEAADWFRAGADTFYRDDVTGDRAASNRPLHHLIALYDAGKLQQAVVIADSLWSARASSRPPELTEYRSLIAARLGGGSAARTAADTTGVGALSLYTRARMAAAWGDQEEALRLLERAFLSRENFQTPTLVHRDREWEALRKNARFRDLTRPR